jgi:hypothetical protein
MLNLVGFVLAHLVYWGRRAPHSAFVTVLVSAVVSAFVTLALLAQADAGFGTHSSYITSNGTTNHGWQVAGSTGPGWYEGDAGGLVAELEGGTNVLLDVGDTPSTVSLSAGVSLTGAAGAGGVQLGNLTGSTNLPTGALTWSPLGNSVSVMLKATHQAVLDAVGGIFIGTNLSASTIDIGHPTTTSINISANDVALLSGATTIMMVQPTGFVPGSAMGTIICGTGGTQVIPANSFAGGVTTGTLSSPCLLNFATNASSGYYLLDMTGVTLDATFGITFQNGTVSKNYVSSSTVSGTLAHVLTRGPNSLAVDW